MGLSKVGRERFDEKIFLFLSKCLNAPLSKQVYFFTLYHFTLKSITNLKYKELSFMLERYLVKCQLFSLLKSLGMNK